MNLSSSLGRGLPFRCIYQILSAKSLLGMNQGVGKIKATDTADMLWETLQPFVEVAHQWLISNNDILNLNRKTLFYGLNLYCRPRPVKEVYVTLLNFSLAWNWIKQSYNVLRGKYYKRKRKYLSDVPKVTLLCTDNSHFLLYKQENIHTLKQLFIKEFCFYLFNLLSNRWPALQRC